MPWRFYLSPDLPVFFYCLSRWRNVGGRAIFFGKNNNTHECNTDVCAETNSFSFVWLPVVPEVAFLFFCSEWQPTPQQTLRALSNKGSESGWWGATPFDSALTTVKGGWFLSQQRSKGLGSLTRCLGLVPCVCRILWTRLWICSHCEGPAGLLCMEENYCYIAW